MRKEDSSIKIERVSEHQIEEVLNLYADLFHDREPLTKRLGFGRERMIAIARAMHGPEELSRTLCWIAKDCADADRGVGFIVCDDSAAGAPQGIPEGLTESETEMVSALAALLEELYAPLKERTGSEKGVSLHIAAIGVAPLYEGMGIAGRLLQAALEEAEARGFRCAAAECTSPASRALHEKCGFTTLRTLSVADFELDGKRPFADCDFDIHLVRKGLGERKSTSADSILSDSPLQAVFRR